MAIQHFTRHATGSFELFQLPAAPALSQAALLRNNPARVGEPAFADDSRPDFEDNHPAEQLMALDSVCRDADFRRAVGESLTEDDRSPEIPKAISNTSMSDRELGALVRSIALGYAQSCANYRGIDLRDYL
jgi:hypothetical protein